MEENTIPPAPDIQEFIRTHKRSLIIVGFSLFAFYVGLNVFVWGIARKTAKQQVQFTDNNMESILKNAHMESPDQLVDSMPETLPTFTPTPTPRPTGPGPHACSSIGTCKLYADDVRKEKCTQTYADDLCLDQCADSVKQCKE